MRISDWISDVCSSDLFEGRDPRLQFGGLGFALGVTPILVFARRGVLRRLDRTEECRDQVVLQGVILVRDERDQMQMPIRGAAAPQIPNVGFYDGQIGRASCRERVCQYV